MPELSAGIFCIGEKSLSVFSVTIFKLLTTTTRAKIISANGERIAIFKYDGKLSAVSNVCKHQNGPLGEGKIVDGCITCPWHGYQYLPQNGQSPPPFKERVSTYDVRLEKNTVWLNPKPYPEGTERPGAVIPLQTSLEGETFAVSNY